MKEPEQNVPPRSIIKGSGFVNADLSFLDSKGKSKILFVDSVGVVIGIDDKPYLLNATSKFNEDILPIGIKTDLKSVKMLILQCTFSMEPHLKNKYCQLPKWVTELKNIVFLRLDHINIDNFDILRKLPIQYLVLSKVNYSDVNKLINNVKKMKYIKYIVFSEDCPVDLVKVLEKSSLKSILISQSEYYKRKINEECVYIINQFHIAGVCPLSSRRVFSERPCGDEKAYTKKDKR